MTSPSPDPAPLPDPLWGGPQPWRNTSRSPLWWACRRRHLGREPCCAWCGTRVDLQVHHIIPFHIEPALELEAANLITLCEPPGPEGCHLRRGHMGRWTLFDPFIRLECDLKNHQRGGPMTLIQLKVKTAQALGLLALLASSTATTFDDDVVEFLNYLASDTQAVDKAWELLQKHRAAKVQAAAAEFSADPQTGG